MYVTYGTGAQAYLSGTKQTTNYLLFKIQLLSLTIV